MSLRPYYDHAGITIYHSDCREILPQLPKVDLVRYCDELARKNSEALSFIPRPKLEEYARSGQLLMETQGDEPCGFLIYGNGFPTLRVYQACIQYDARRREHGFHLVRRLIRIADERKCEAISLWCASDLESNEFWRQAGFSFCGQREGGRRRGRTHNLWRMELWPSLLGRKAIGIEIEEKYCEIAAKRLSQEVLAFS